MTTSTEHDPYFEEYKKLVGKKVKGVVYDPEGEFYGLLMSDKSIAWIVMDPELNGPGFLSIEDHPHVTR